MMFVFLGSGIRVVRGKGDIVINGQSLPLHGKEKGRPCLRSRMVGSHCRQHLQSSEKMGMQTSPLVFDIWLLSAGVLAERDGVVLGGLLIFA